MNTSWTTFRKRFGKTEPEAPPSPQAAAGPAPAKPAPAPYQAPARAEPMLRPDGSLDAVGQKNELIRVRFANLIDRLEEIRSLKEDFALLAEPVTTSSAPIRRSSPACSKPRRCCARSATRPLACAGRSPTSRRGMPA